MFRRILPSILLAALLLSGCATQNCTKCKGVSRQAPVGSVQTVRTTAYTSAEPGGAHSACGTHLCSSNAKGKVKSAASDWARYPLGTRFQILTTGEVYEVCDYGSALVGKNTIDLYKSSRREMRQWGARVVVIKILQWGSPQRSLQVLAPRTRCQHVRSMLADLRQET